jgi:predicted RNase H-like nuclease (RuvC/YqgF family)
MWTEEVRARLEQWCRVNTLGITSPLREAIQAALAEIERLKTCEECGRRGDHCAEYQEQAQEIERLRDLESQVESVVAQRDDLTRELLAENERHAATTERVRTLELDLEVAESRKSGVIRDLKARVRTLEEALRELLNYTEQVEQMAYDITEQIEIHPVVAKARAALREEGK